ncbi:MAG: hypothetical protein EON95_09145 [Caulobacteraceae bacterium]|nr:MAG: hypothetical protein EON95_09145 [Caulobacteraceae bacterium]
MGRHDRKTSYLLTLNRHPAFAILLLILLIAAIAALNGFVEINGARWINRPPVVWAGTALLLTLAVAVMGGSVNGRLAGVLIDNRNRVSLSKFQAALWTILVVSALATAAAVNITDWPAALAAWDAHQLTLPAANPPAERPTGPLDINLPTELLHLAQIGRGPVGHLLAQEHVGPGRQLRRGQRQHLARRLHLPIRQVQLLPGLVEFARRRLIVGLQAQQ